jgi:hypothetical protein
MQAKRSGLSPDFVSITMKLFSSFALALLCASTASATIFSVAAGDSTGLAQAIAAANKNPGADVIELAGGMYSLSQQFPASENAWAALPVITDTVVIRGNRSELRAYTNAKVHLLEIAHGVQVRLQALTLAEGSNGALVNYGNTELARVSIVDQTSRNAEGILRNFGELQMERCDISYNTIANASQNAGTIVNYGYAGIRNTRILGNRVSRRFETLALASVLMNYGKADLDQVLLSGNEAADSVPTVRVSGVAEAFVDRGNGRTVMREVQVEQ